MVKTHRLKTVNPYFQDIWNFKKLFEVRINDRDFKVRDKLVLLEYDPKANKYSGRGVFTSIDYILDDPKFLETGYVVIQLSLQMKTVASVPGEEMLG